MYVESIPFPETRDYVPLMLAMNQSSLDVTDKPGESLVLDHWIERGHNYQERALSRWYGSCLLLLLCLSR